LSATGLDVKIAFLPYEKLIEHLYVTGEKAGQALFIGASNPLGDISHNPVQFLPTDGVVSVYSNKQIDKEIKGAEVETDPKVRQEKFEEVLGTACEQAAMLDTIEWKEIFGFSNRLTWNPGVYSTGGRWSYDDMTVVEPS
jgi:peptide/nickel transport system substrate-binding protein